MNRYLILLLLVAVAAMAQQNAAPEVTHMWAQQRPNTNLVDVNYSVVDPDNSSLSVSLVLLDGSGTVVRQCTSVTGDVGAGVTPGTNLHITWDAGADFSAQFGSDYTLRIVADDGFVATLEGFVLMPAGTFTMGSPTSEAMRAEFETQHQVTLTHGFYAQATEVTNRQYMELAQWAYDRGYVTVNGVALCDNVDGSTQVLKTLGPGEYEITFTSGVFSCVNPDHPVKHVSWYGAVAYCDWLSMQQGLPRAYLHQGIGSLWPWPCNGNSPYTAVGYRLPTEAEWEYACRAGTTTAFGNGPMTYSACSPVDPSLEQIGWYCGDSEGWTHPVAQLAPNAWGLYDMHGNVHEWCNDWYTTLGRFPVIDPVGGTGYNRVARGGHFGAEAHYCRSARRFNLYPYTKGSYLGFRPVRTCFPE